MLIFGHEPDDEGGQPRYSDLAIETTLMLGCAFGMLRLRQTEGLIL
jgi:hypothetical protein